MKQYTFELNFNALYRSGLREYFKGEEFEDWDLFNELSYEMEHANGVYDLFGIVCYIMGHE